MTSRSADDHQGPAPRERDGGPVPGDAGPAPGDDDDPLPGDAADPGPAPGDGVDPGPAPIDGVDPGPTPVGGIDPGPTPGDGGRSAPVPAQRPPLDDLAQRILAFERQWWRRPGAKEQAIRDRFGLSTTRYYQLLNALLDDPGALAHDPVLVLRLRRLRQRRPGGTGRGGLR